LLRTAGPQRRERGEIDGRVFSCNELRHDAGRSRGEQYAVPEVSGGEELVSVVRKRAEKREIVGGGGTKSCPGFQFGRFGDGREEPSGAGAELCDVSGIDRFIEAGGFDCRTNDGADPGGVIGARDYIDVWSAEDDMKRQGGRESHGEHLTLAG
jgi:hypothetical protein